MKQFLLWGYNMKTLRNTIIALIALVSVYTMADNNNLVNVNVFRRTYDLWTTVHPNDCHYQKGIWLSKTLK